MGSNLSQEKKKQRYYGNERCWWMARGKGPLAKMCPPRLERGVLSRVWSGEKIKQSSVRKKPVLEQLCIENPEGWLDKNLSHPKPKKGMSS